MSNKYYIKLVNHKVLGTVTLPFECDYDHILMEIKTYFKDCDSISVSKAV